MNKLSISEEIYYFMLLCVILLFFNNFHIGSYDAKSAYLLTRSIVDRGEFYLSKDHSNYGREGRDGRIYIKYGLMRSIAAIPLYILGKSASIFVPWVSKELLCEALTSISNIFFTALTAFLIFKLFLLHSVSQRMSRIAGILYLLSTISLQYSRDMMGEPLVAMFLLYSFYKLIIYDRYRFKKDIISAGMYFGAAVLTVSSILLLLPVFIFVFSGIFLDRKILKIIKNKSLIFFSLPVLSFMIVILLYNYVRFGDIFESGYGSEIHDGFSYPFFRGLFGILLSPGKGIFITSPILLCGLFIIKKNYNDYPALFKTGISITIILSLFYAKWYVWGSSVWGVRFLLPAVPFLFLLLLPLFKSNDISGSIRYVFYLLTVTSIIFQILSVSVNPTREKRRMMVMNNWSETEVEEAQSFSIRHSPFIGQLRSIKYVIKSEDTNISFSREKNTEYSKIFSWNIIDIAPVWIYYYFRLRCSTFIIIVVVWLAVITLLIHKTMSLFFYWTR